MFNLFVFKLYMLIL